jgi:hypothetical protein
MRCPNCGVENDAGARFCSNCGQSLAAAAPGGTTPGGEPTERVPPPSGAPTPPASSEPTQPVSPSDGEPTEPVLPPTPSKVMATPPSPPPPPPPIRGPSGPADAGGPSKRPSLTVLAIGGALAVIVIGLIVWAVFLRDDDAGTSSALPVPTGTPSSEPEGTGATGTPGTPGTTGATGATGSISGATGVSGGSGATGDAFTVKIRMCESVTQKGRCVNAFPYDPASGWTIPVTAPSFTVLVTTEGLQEGDQISIDFNDVNRDGETYYSTDLDPAPAEVVDYAQWIYWLPLVTPETGSFPPGSKTELVFSRNGEEITFQGPNVYTFG